MPDLVHKLRGAVARFVDHGSEGAAPDTALVIRRARSFGFVAFGVLCTAMAASLVQGHVRTACFSLSGMGVYGACMHWMSRDAGRWVRPACHVAIGYLLVTITLASLYLGGASPASVTYPTLLILGAMYALGVRAAVAWTISSIAALGWVVFSATLPPPAPGALEMGPGLIFFSRASVLGGVFAIAALGRRFEDRQTEQLRFLARHDPLTGLYNRREFDQRMGEALARAQRYGHQPCLLFIDLDSFKQINDVYGHAVGDEVLRAVAGVLAEQTRRTDASGRIGGDEFAVLLEDGGEAKSAERHALRLLARIRASEDQQLAPVAVRASIGLAIHPRHGADAEALMRSADAAMYRAKRAGGDRVVLSDEPAGAVG